MERVIVRFLGIALLCLMLGSMFGGLPNTANAANFGIGDTIEVYNTGSSGLLVRDAPCGSIIGGKFDGDRGVVLDGPVYCNNYNRWLIRWNSGLEGWSAEDWLRKISQPPSPPTLVSPPKGANDVSLTPTFKWNSVSNADYYGLYISEPPYGSSNLVYDNDAVYGTSLTLPSGRLSPGVKYYWNMRSHNSAGWGGFSDSWYFTTTPPVDNIPTISITSPSNNQHFPYSTSGVTVQGTANDDHQVTLVQVRVNSGSWATASGTTSWSKSVNLEVGANRIEARAKDSNNQYSAIASITVYREEQKPPSPPTPTSPGTSSSPGPVIDTLTPTFQWSGASGADYYGLYIRDLATNTLVFDSQARGIQITGTPYPLPSGVLEWGKPYRWNMNSHSSAGWGSYSGVLYFQTKEPQDKPPNVNSFSVSSSRIKQGEAVTLSYTVSDDVGLKQVELWRADDTAGIDFREIKAVSVSGKSYSGSFSDTPPSLGTYRYGLHVVDAAGNWNCERNSQTGFSPGVYGPKEVIVEAPPPTPTPQITGVDPAQPVAQPDRQWLGILGTGFNAESQVILRIGSSEYLIPSERTQFVSSARIDTFVGLTDTGTWTAQVINPSNRESNVFSFTVVSQIPEDVYWLAKAIMSEASVGTREEQIGVGWTVLNRLYSRDYGSSVRQVVEDGYVYNQEPTSAIVTLASDLLEGKVDDPTGGATHFFSPISMPWEGDEGQYISRLKAHFNAFDTYGGLHQVPGTSQKVYFPSWAKPKEGWTVSNFYHTVGNLEWASGLSNVRNWYFMFYRPISSQSVAHPVIASPLVITPVKEKYYVGDTLTAKFTITNEGTAPITFDVLTVGGRFNDGKLPNGEYPDFTWSRNIVLNPGGSHQYQGSLILNEAGNYHFFCAYRTPDGNWNPSVDFGEGLTDEDRIEDIVVLLLPEGPGVEDILTVLDAYFKSEPSDLLEGKVPTVDDIFNLLDAYFQS